MQTDLGPLSQSQERHVLTKGLLHSTPPTPTFSYSSCRGALGPLSLRDSLLEAGRMLLLRRGCLLSFAFVRRSQRCGRRTAPQRRPCGLFRAGSGTGATGPLFSSATSSACGLCEHCVLPLRQAEGVLQLCVLAQAAGRHLARAGAADECLLRMNTARCCVNRFWTKAPSSLLLAP